MIAPVISEHTNFQEEIYLLQQKVLDLNSLRVDLLAQQFKDRTQKDYRKTYQPT